MQNLKCARRLCICDVRATVTIGAQSWTTVCNLAGDGFASIFLLVS